MTHIKSRKHPARSAHAHLATTALSASLALALPMMAHAADDNADADKTRKPDATTLDKVEVRGLRSFVVSPKFTQTLQDTPQTIEVIGKELLQEQGATTLTEALRNSPGVGTFYAGENGNTSTGDTLYMRGFDTSSSIFVDGARDLGSVSRDLFNMEQVEVVKGPASTDTGRSSPTGAINMVTKQAQLREAVSGSVSAGVDGQKRATADWNTKLSDSSALRVNAMWQDSDVPGRDHVNNSRWGIAPSLGFGLDGNTRLWLDLLYVKQDNVPDGFVPTIGLPYWTPQPGLENLAGHPVDPSNFYGTRDDHENVTAQMATLRFEHDFSDTLKISNTLRWGKTDQDYLLTAFMSTGGTNANPLAGNIKWTDKNDLSTYTLSRSNPTFRDNQNKILTNQFNLRADFGTGAVDHFLSAGVELTREEQTAPGITSTGSRPAANLYDPDWNDAGTFAWSHNGTHAHGQTDTSALYVFDTMKFGEHFLLTAGLRADHYTTKYFANAICNTAGTGAPGRGIVYCGTAAVGSIITSSDLKDSDTLLSWKIGAVYKPVEALSLYANAALAQQPPGGANFQLAVGSSSANGVDADPQVARTLEVGTKWAANESLTLNLALFQTTVSNEINTQENPATQTGRKQVKGVEASAVGNITDNWNVSLGYLHQSAEVDKGSLVAADGTPNLTYTPSDSFTSWTTYKFPFGLTVGGGVRYMGGLHRGTDGAAGTPKLTKPWTVYDAVISYAVNDNLTLRLNGYNLFDKAYVASINKSGYRYTPGTPRTFLLSADFRF
ncbi:catecholate siderophore receptor Fiu [Thermomonas brevis]|uniref:Catecholate siderophore receptor Fiu n=1 Tax=Thermomonas brevis TaxID=215691 RepID=A0A7G9QUU4_9GAMM|nr:catecholate siderophore receptor Fiu [Thermomonas brevis]QNN47119.1 catecholate siderophore receptor Fiu [Thermomonas brevis]